MPIMDDIREQTNAKESFVLCPGNPINVPCFQREGKKDGDVGLELEIEGRNLPVDAFLTNVVSPTTKKQWLSINDGSLRNGGREFVTSGPINVSEVRHMVDGLFGTIARNNGTIDNSNRCSTHVHVNVSDLKVNQITSAIALWITFQTCLTRWHGTERIKNHFCLSTRDEEGMLEAWADYLSNGMRAERGYRDNVKYTALNIIPIWTQGSLEFRVGGPPDDPDKIVYWAKICNAIVRYAAQHFANPLDYGYAISEQGPEGILKSVLEFANLGPLTTKRLYEEFTASPAFHVECMEDFRDAQFLIYAYPWGDLMDKINEEFVPNPFDNKKKLVNKGIGLRPDEIRFINELANAGRVAAPPVAPLAPVDIWDDE